MLIQNKHIAIVGAGPGGLTLARLLQLKGVNVKVYERDINKVFTDGCSGDAHFFSNCSTNSEYMPLHKMSEPVHEKLLK